MFFWRIDMKIAYLVLAHKDPSHLERLINSLLTPQSAFYIHLDNKSDISEFLYLEGEQVHYTKERLSVYYDFSLVEATLILMRTALIDECNFDYFVRLHGVDYPVQPASYIENFFEHNDGSEFIEMMPTKSGDKEFPVNRLVKYKLPVGASAIEKLSLKFSSLFGFKRDRIREFSKFQLTPYWGSGLWGLSRNACEYIVNYAQKHQKLLRYFRFTHIPIEMIFQTILGNSPHMFKISPYFHYINWSSQQRHPPELTGKHLSYFSSSLKVMDGDREILFANKFSSKNKHIVDELDRIIFEKEKAYKSIQ